MLQKSGVRIGSRRPATPSGLHCHGFGVHTATTLRGTAPRAPVVEHQRRTFTVICESRADALPLPGSTSVSGQVPLSAATHEPSEREAAAGLGLQLVHGHRRYC